MGKLNSLLTVQCYLLFWIENASIGIGMSWASNGLCGTAICSNRSLQIPIFEAIYTICRTPRTAIKWLQYPQPSGHSQHVYGKLISFSVLKQRVTKYAFAVCERLLSTFDVIDGLTSHRIKQISFSSLIFWLFAIANFLINVPTFRKLICSYTNIFLRIPFK
jgi:hypothetical protein